MPVSHVCSLPDPSCEVPRLPVCIQSPHDANARPAPRRSNTASTPPTQGSPGQAPAVRGPPSRELPPRQWRPSSLRHWPPGHLVSSGWAPGASPPPNPPLLARVSSSGFGNVRSSQECLLKCSRPSEQKSATPPSAPLEHAESSVL